MTRISTEKQESYPLPSICISLARISEDKLSSHNLTLTGYRTEGYWKSNLSQLDEEVTYNDISEAFGDLVEKIDIERRTSNVSDAYENITMNNEDDKLILDRCDYYINLKCFCINFAHQKVLYGVQNIYIYFKMDSEMFVVAPQNFYSFKRKHTEIEIKTKYSYKYVLHHRTVKSFTRSKDAML